MREFFDHRRHRSFSHGDASRGLADAFCRRLSQPGDIDRVARALGAITNLWSCAERFMPLRIGRFTPPAGRTIVLFRPHHQLKDEQFTKDKAIDAPTASIRGRFMIVTGGASGIGEAAARLLACHGAKMTIADRTVEAGGALARKLTAADRAAQFIQTDISNEEQVAAVKPISAPVVPSTMPRVHPAASRWAR